jgi:hypothetical protein
MLLLEGEELRRLEPDGFTVREAVKLPARYEFIGERDGYFVALSDEAKRLDLIDKKTLQVIRSVRMDYRERYDLALNPVKDVSYVAVPNAGEGVIKYQILVVDEASGDVREPAGFAGRWIKVSPDGRWLYAAYKDVYQKGNELLVNPDAIHVLPRYGNIDQLHVYAIAGPVPRRAAVKEEAGGNGFGLALSADGKRVSYLSYVGYPLYSGNVPAWDPADLTKRPVSYPCKANKAGATKIAFHPVLEIAAAPSEDGAVAFHRETGEVQARRLDLRPALAAGVKVHDCVFSADGRHLLLVCEDPGTKERYLRKVKLNLSPEEAAKAGKPPLAPPPPPPAEDERPRPPIQKAAAPGRTGAVAPAGVG